MYHQVTASSTLYSSLAFLHLGNLQRTKPSISELLKDLKRKVSAPPGCRLRYLGLPDLPVEASAFGSVRPRYSGSLQHVSPAHSFG
jgi:hypothetical protein